MRNILPGRPQSTRQALCTVNWDGLRLVAYISGNTIIIFNGRREILQTISVEDDEVLCSLAIEEESGHIAVASKSKVYIYQPFGRDHGDLRWTRTNDFQEAAEKVIATLSWSSSDELLVAGQRLSLWSFAENDTPQIIWSSQPSSPVSVASFSPDSDLIASCSQHDRIVKIWRRLSYEQDSTRFDISYLPHPSTVTNLAWRKAWHQEQSLDNLLYTYCADHRVRIWAQSDHHAVSTLQKIMTIDTRNSIQPRRLSMSTVSKARFSFIIDSRDLARAAERALQTSRQGTDHALEHLIEIANRAPEVCVILDGLGHMSAWGLENAGVKNKLPPEKFNVALVDGVGISLPSSEATNDFAQICAFANNDVSASLCILVHSFSGQIDWYQGSFIEFFDTSDKENRTRLMSCWSGHDSPIYRLVSSSDHRQFLSFSEEDHFMSWAQSGNGALVKHSQGQADAAGLDAVLLTGNDFAVILHEDSISVVNLRSTEATTVASKDLAVKDPISIRQATQRGENDNCTQVTVLSENGDTETFAIHTPGLSQTNGHSEVIESIFKAQIIKDHMDDSINFCKPSAGFFRNRGEILAWSDSILKIQRISDAQTHQPQIASSLSTSIRLSNIGSSINGQYTAVAHADYRTLSIWNNHQGCYEFIHYFADFDWLHELHWHTTSDGILLLAIEFPYHVAVVAQQKYKTNKHEAAWFFKQVIQTRRHSSNVIAGLCWLEPCQIALGLGNQILTFDVAFDLEGEVPKDRSMRGNATTNGPAALLLANSSLPLFHPDAIGPILETGEYDTALTLFEALHNELRYLSRGHSLSDDLNLDTDHYSSGKHEILTNGNTNSQSPISGRNDFDLGDKLDQSRENMDKISERQLSAAQRRNLSGLLSSYVQLIHSQKSMDAHALTYLYHFLTSITTTAMSDVETTSAISTIAPLPYSAIVHASLSQTQEPLLHFVLGHLEQLNIKVSWTTARALGLFLFITNVETLRENFEAVARTEYNRTPDATERNPVDCSLYYLALDKKSILQSLWRRTVGVKEKESTMKLLARNFTEKRWRESALKNAYALLSRRRFEYAAAFFLLGGSLGDAVNVCVNQLHDIQLGVAIARVWSGDSGVQKTVMKGLLEKHLLEAAIDSPEARWMAIWGAVHVQDWLAALRYIVGQVDKLFQVQFKAHLVNQSEEEKKRNMPCESLSYHANEPTLLVNLYLDLRAKMVNQGKWTEEAITPANEWEFVMRCVAWYNRAGMEWLALRLVTRWEFVALQETQDKKDERLTEEKEQDVVVTEQGQKSALDEWMMPDDEDSSAKAGKANKLENREKKDDEGQPKTKPKPPPTQFVEPSADSLLDSFGF